MVVSVMILCVQVREYLTAGWSTPTVQADVAALAAQSNADASSSVAGLLPITLSGTVEVRRTTTGDFPLQFDHFTHFCMQ